MRAAGSKCKRSAVKVTPVRPNDPDFAYKMQFLYQVHLSLSLVKTMTNVTFSWALSSIASRPFGYDQSVISVVFSTMNEFPPLIGRNVVVRDCVQRSS